MTARDASARADIMIDDIKSRIGRAPRAVLTRELAMVSLDMAAAYGPGDGLFAAFREQAAQLADDADRYEIEDRL